MPNVASFSFNVCTTPAEGKTEKHEENSPIEYRVSSLSEEIRIISFPGQGKYISGLSWLSAELRYVWKSNILQPNLEF